MSRLSEFLKVESSIEADKLTTARNINLGGDLSGSASFDGSTDITIVASVQDDSHNHIISNIDGLQSALDDKLDASVYTASDILTKLKTVDGSGSGLDADLLDGHNSSYYIYNHPNYNGDDFDIDTGSLSGATIISNININVTTDTLGHVTDANASVSTRNLTLADLGYTSDDEEKLESTWSYKMILALT